MLTLRQEIGGDMNKTRRSLEEIYKDMDAINNSKPRDKQIDDLAEVISSINEENEVNEESQCSKTVAQN